MVRCNLLADGRMVVSETNPTEPVAFEFLTMPRIGEKIVVMILRRDAVLRVSDVMHYATRVDTEGGAQIMLIASEEGE